MPDPQGRAHSYAATLVPILRDGAVASVALTSLDISEQKAAEQEIRELNRGLEARVRERTADLQRAMERAEAASRAKSEFLSHMSHELRTPMNAILGFAQIIEMSDPTPKQLRWAGEIRRAGDHLLQMIEDLLDLARIEVGKMSIRLEAFELEPVLAESLAIMQPLIAARGLRLVLDGSRCAGHRVNADRLRLRQVLVNLLSNAAKYNRPQGSITVSCHETPAGVRLSVTDTGAGMAAERLAGLFRPFERLGAELGDVEGTGIGLALSKQLADMMGATLGAASEVNVGSTFWIDLSRAEGGVVPAAAPVAAPHAMRVVPFDVLYIEDNLSNLEVMVAFLAPHAHVRLRTATSGDAGLAMAGERPPDIILLDIHLPGMDGYEVLQRLRADAALRSIPVIALSADAMPHDMQRGLDAGFDRYLAKPVDLNELLGALDALLGGSRPAPG
jgi:signal transduction histidine kinase/CheY-like chemotaxis protein